MSRLWFLLLGFLLYPLGMPFFLHYYPDLGEGYIRIYAKYVELLSKIFGWW
jgi:hypothetical protein